MWYQNLLTDGTIYSFLKLGEQSVILRSNCCLVLLSEWQPWYQELRRALSFETTLFCSKWQMRQLVRSTVMIYKRCSQLKSNEQRISYEIYIQIYAYTCTCIFQGLTEWYNFKPLQIVVEVLLSVVTRSVRSWESVDTILVFQTGKHVTNFNHKCEHFVAKGQSK